MIRRLKPTDAKSYQALRLTCLKNDPLSWLSTHKIDSIYPDQYFINKIQHALSPPIFGYYGYFQNNTLVGMIQISKSNLIKKRHIVNIFEVCVHPKHRRKSVATKLMKHLIKKVKSQPGIEQICLFVNSKSKAATSLYEKLGFTKIATLLNAVKEPDNSYQDEFVYRYLINRR